MLGLWTTPFYHTGFSASEAVNRAPLCLHGEFLDSMDLPPREFLDRIQSALRGLTLLPPHHVAPSSACHPAALASAEYVFVRKVDFIQPLSQLYRGPYRVLSCQDNFFSLEISSRQDTVSLDKTQTCARTCSRTCPQS